MKRSATWLVVFAMVCVFLCSCGETDPSRKPTYPVTGEVYVDGQPAAELAVRCTDVKGLDKENPTISSAFTDEEGKFEISTYEAADGVPAGEYILTFMWGQWNRVSGSYGGPDKLGDRYSNPETSEHRITVKEGEPTDLGRIELTTK